MRYTAIARLSKDNSNGFRIYDRLDGSIIDIEYDKLKSLISSNDIYVRNLKVIKGEIKSFGGDLNDLALILNGNIVKNSLVILARVGNNFKVVDCMGKVHEVTSDVLRNLVNNKRVFNGKVRKYAGTKYSIDNKGVSFSIEKNKKLAKSVRNNKKYIGEYVSDFVPNHFLSNSVDGKIMTYTVLSMVNGESIRIDSYTGYSYNILNSKVKNDRELHTHEGYNIFGKINKELNLNNCFEEVRELISTSDIMLKIQKSIEEYNKEIKALKIKARVDSKTGLLVSSEVKYSNIFIEARNVEVNRVDDEVVQDVIDKLRVMKVKVRVRTEYTSSDNILLYRICTKDNIKYKVYKKKN